MGAAMKPDARFRERLARFPTLPGAAIARFFRTERGDVYRVSADGAVWDGAGGSPIGEVVSNPKDPHG